MIIIPSNFSEELSSWRQDRHQEEKAPAMTVMTLIVWSRNASQIMTCCISKSVLCSILEPLQGSYLNSQKISLVHIQRRTKPALKPCDAYAASHLAQEVGAFGVMAKEAVKFLWRRLLLISNSPLKRGGWSAGYIHTYIHTYFYFSLTLSVCYMFDWVMCIYI